MKNFALSWDISRAEASHDQIIGFISENRHVQQWLAPFPGFILIKTDSDILELSQSITRFLTRSYFFLAIVDPVTSAGALTPDMWNWFNRGILPDSEVERIANMRKEITKSRAETKK
ncbi:hypothetical protein [Sphingomonas sp.]|jgi:hypothetical protein|uniref:hypothetical protein n=1 Tax=Sphingomonas sp. TaxID=28214 RepID=UPI002E146EB0|nr:hypothetical protein [Sphingomonas sp.]